MIEIATGYIPTSPDWTYGTNDSDLIKVLVPIDFTLVIAFLLSFLAMVLGFDSICGERENGTLKLLLANSVPRSHIVVAKLLGGMLTLAIPLAIGFLLALLILVNNSNIAFSGDEWTRLGLFFLISFLFLSQIFSLSLMVSCFTRTTSTSLIICLVAWLAGSVVYTNVMPSFIRYFIEEEPVQLFRNRQSALWEEYGRQIEEWEKRNPGPGEVYLKGVDQDGKLRYAHPRGYEWLQRHNEYSIARNMERAQKTYDALWAHQEEFALQALLVDEYSILSPFTNYRALIHQLARTTMDDKFYLVKAGHRYRDTFIDYLRARRAFSSRRWFSDDPEDQDSMIPDPEAVTPQMLAPDSPFMKERLAWVQEQEKRAANDARRKLDLSALPKFGKAGSRTLAQSLGVMTPGLAVLLLSLGLSAVATINRFNHYDPT